MANTSGKKVSLLFSPALLKAAKLKAAENEQSLEDWLLSLVQKQLQDNQAGTMTALDWGRVDSRIDQRIVFLERQVEALADNLELVLREQKPLRTLTRKSLDHDSALGGGLTCLVKTG